MIAPRCPRALHGRDRVPAINRLAVRRREVVGLVLVVRRHGHARVIMRAPHGVPVAGDERPIRTTILGPPELPILRGLAVPRDAIARFNQRVDPIRIGRRDGDGNFAHRLGGQPVPRELLPRDAAIAGDMESASRSAARAPPRVDLELPHSGEHHARILRVHRQIGASCVLVNVEHPGPCRAAVRCAKHAALRLRPVGVAKRTDEYNVGIVRMNDRARNAPRLFQPHQRPRPTRIHRFVHPLTDRDVRANLPLAGAGPDDAGVGLRDRERANRLHGEAVEHRRPIHPAVGGLPHPA